MAFAESIIDRWDGAGGLIHMGLALETGANWMLHNATSDELILAGVEFAKKRNLKITNHCAAGTPWLSIKEFTHATGGGDVDYLFKLGALVDNWVLAHGVHLKRNEIERVAEAGSSVITNPASNAYSSDGIAPVKTMFELGVNVGLGSDGVLRELLHGYGATDEVRRADPERYSLRPDPDFVGARPGDGDD